MFLIFAVDLSIYECAIHYYGYHHMHPHVLLLLLLFLPIVLLAAGLRRGASHDIAQTALRSERYRTTTTMSMRRGRMAGNPANIEAGG